jgi:hypothetical protein
MDSKKLPPLPPSLRRRPTKNGGYFIQSNYGEKGNFELIIRIDAEPGVGSRLQHWYRNNDDPNPQWVKTFTFEPKDYRFPTLIQSNVGFKGDFEVVVFHENLSTLDHWHRINDDPTLPWVQTDTFASDIWNGPALIQSNLGFKGDFEVVASIVPEGGGPSRLEHWYRNNDDPNPQWVKRSSFGSDVFGENRLSRPALIQSNYGEKGNFELVVNVYQDSTSGLLQHWYRNNNDPNPQWVKTSSFAWPVTGAPALIQSNFGEKGDFEVVVRNNLGQLEHWRRNNDDPNPQWFRAFTFGSRASYGTPALIQSNFGAKGDFEVVFRNVEGRLEHWRRKNDGIGLPWVQTDTFASNVSINL